MTNFTGILFAALIGAQDATPLPTAHTAKVIEGWTVHVDNRLLEDPNKELGERSLRILANRLYDIQMVVPEDKLARLRKVPIWLDLNHGKLKPAQYHPSAGWLKGNGFSEKLAKCVHIPVAAGFASIGHQSVQPWSVLHELAHAYHDQELGFDHPAVKAAWEKYRDKSDYAANTLHINGNKTKHYALTNPMEFFAEMSESYFGQNDFYPFNRAELKTAEPEIFELLQAIWGPHRGERKK